MLNVYNINKHIKCFILNNECSYQNVDSYMLDKYTIFSIHSISLISEEALKLKKCMGPKILSYIRDHSCLGKIDNILIYMYIHICYFFYTVHTIKTRYFLFFFLYNKIEKKKKSVKTVLLVWIILVNELVQTKTKIKQFEEHQNDMITSSTHFYKILQFFTNVLRVWINTHSKLFDSGLTV